MQLSPNVEESQYYFDHGYNLAYVALIWTISILFSMIAPFIPIIAFFFFLIKYFVDKYNFMYVYPTEFDHKEPFSIKVSFICTASLFGFQAFMFMFFQIVFGELFVWPAVAILVLELIG